MTPTQLAVVSLLLLFPLCQGTPECPKCGNTTVPYPLSTSSSCGDQQYKVVCNMSEGKLSLNTQSGNYPVVSISPTTQRLVIGSPTITTANSCASSDLSSGGLVLDSSLPFNVTSTNTVLLLNCSTTLLYSPLNCTSKSLCTEFLAQDSEAKPCANKLCCTFTAGGSSTSHKIGVKDGDCTAYVSVLGINANLPVNEWNYGIELEWASPLEPVCRSQKDCDSLSTCQMDSTTNALRCMCKQGYRWNALTGNCTDNALMCSDGSRCAKKRREAPLIAGIVMGILVCCVVALILFVVQRRRRAVKEARTKLSKERQLILSEGSGGRSAKLYTSQEMKKATQNFAKERLLGSGGFGDVYKGVLEDGTVVAVKSAKVGNIKGIEQVLNEGDRGTFLDWRTRLKVAVQTAEGLTYLHSSANPPIYHRDVKSSNILLDAELNAKVSDFGLSRLAQADLSHISTCAQGTLGYLDPEYYRNYQLTAKSDVYSFGVVLLELVTSQRAIEFARGQDNVNLAIYVDGMAEEGRAMEVVDPRLLGHNADVGVLGFASGVGFDSSSTAFDSSSTANLSTSSPAPLLQNAVSVRSCQQEEENGGMRGATSSAVGEAAVAESIYKVVYLALSCLQDSRSERPSMKEVSEELQRSLPALEAALGYGNGLRAVNNGGLSGISAGPRPTEEGFEGTTSGFMSSASTISSPRRDHAIPR
ncbi:hypothetical protein GOP47_0010040 [Adiantum capillus-veneris]|uniref:Protein kinase domain-containing protein n=1 Tax=Adiantum capillus-veneris TaxID=13818 RepID=A0A9D4ZG11_ADICA|nr:hypothetical protein GOP47_0010040 [Adiantum capillus-veneris]